MNKALARGVCKRWTFHNLRTKAGSDKATLWEAQALLGHASSDTTKRHYKANMTVAEPVKRVRRQNSF
jgi:integrase